MAGPQALFKKDEALLEPLTIVLKEHTAGHLTSARQYLKLNPGLGST